MPTKKKIEWTHKDGDTYYRVTAALLKGKPNTVAALIQVKGKADSEYLPLELGTHVIRLLNLFAKTQKEKEDAEGNQTQ